MQNNLTNSSGRMENPYLTTPALLGLSQHTAGFSEALRMSRTFAHQATDSKDYGGPFGGGPLALRSSFDFPSLPSPLFQTSPFLLAGMDPRLSFPGSAFHPVTSAAAAAAAAAASAPFDRKYFSPTKREPKPEPGGEYGEVSSTATARRSAEDEERNSSGSERSSPEGGRPRKRAPSPVDPSRCPVCGAALQPGEVADHCRAELERLLQLSSAGRERRDRDGLGWETYHRVRGNRQLRLRCKLRKRRGEEPSDCGGCGASDRVGQQEPERPAKRPAPAPGGSAGVPGSPGKPAAEEEEVDVLGDADCDGAAAGGDWRRLHEDSGATDLRTGVEVCRNSPGYEDGVPDTTAEKSSANSDQVTPLTAELERLRARLSALEHESSRCRCGVCGNTFRQPLVSTHCWHVHCTACWNAALGGDRRCPQCSVHVTADDLNAIHV